MASEITFVDSPATLANAANLNTLKSFQAKRATHTVGSPNSLFATAGSFTYLQRFIVTLPVTTTQWRLKVANQNALTGSAPGMNATVDTVYVGTPTYATNAGWVGNSAVLSQALTATAITVNASGADGTSAFVTASNLQFAAYQPLVISMACTIGAGGTGIITSDALAFTGIGVNADVGVANPAISQGPFGFDVRVEYDALTQVTTPVGFFVCASDGSYSPDGGGILPTQAWPHVSGLINCHPAIDSALGGALTSDYTTTTNRPWTRFDLATYPPDYGVIGALISNDIAGMVGGDTATAPQIATALATIKANVSTILTNLATFGCKRTFICTVPPRGTFTAAGSWENLRGQVNSWIRTLPRGIEAVLDIDRALRNPAAFYQIDPLLVSSDGIHFNQAGQQRVGREAMIASYK